MSPLTTQLVSIEHAILIQHNTRTCWLHFTRNIMWRMSHMISQKWCISALIETKSPKVTTSFWLANTRRFDHKNFRWSQRRWSCQQSDLYVSLCHLTYGSYYNVGRPCVVLWFILSRLHPNDKHPRFIIFLPNNFHKHIRDQYPKHWRWGYTQVCIPEYGGMLCGSDSPDAQANCL